MSSGGQITVKLLMLDSVLRFTTNGNTLEYQISGVVCIIKMWKMFMHHVHHSDILAN